MCDIDFGGLLVFGGAVRFLCDFGDLSVCLGFSAFEISGFLWVLCFSCVLG